MRRDEVAKTGMSHEVQVCPRFPGEDVIEPGTSFAERRSPVFKGR
jgi:hypothetical protein